MPQVTVQCGDRVKIITASLHDVRNAFTQRGVDGVRLDGVNFYLSIREGYGGSIHGVGTGAGHDADKRSGHSAGLVQRCQVAECASLRRLDQSLACFRYLVLSFLPIGAARGSLRDSGLRALPST